MESKIQSTELRELFPWIRFFRTFSIAVDVRKVVLAALGLVTFSVGNALISRLPFAPAAHPVSKKVASVKQNANISKPRVESWNASIVEVEKDFGDISPLVRVAQMLEDPWNNLAEIFREGGLVLLRPLRGILDPAVLLFRTDHSWADIAYAWTRLLWALCVWAIFAGAITRLAATQFAIDERLTIKEALSFSVQRFPSYIAAVLLPLAGVGFFWLACCVGGALGRIPVVGEWLVGALWFLPLLAGLIMAMIIVGVAVGWPLMVAAISTEGSDGFDGLSRAYSYVYNRPWYYLFLGVLLLLYGAAAVFFVWLMATLVAYLSGWGVAAGLGLSRVKFLFGEAPQLFGGPDLLPGEAAAAGGMGYAGITLVGVWLRGLSLLTVGFVYSFFWVAVTITYFLLRKSDDDTEFDEVFMPQPEPQFDGTTGTCSVASAPEPVTSSFSSAAEEATQTETAKEASEEGQKEAEKTEQGTTSAGGADVQSDGSAEEAAGKKEAETEDAPQQISDSQQSQQSSSESESEAASQQQSEQTPQTPSQESDSTEKSSDEQEG